MERYLTSEQVADLLQVHQFTVLKYLKSGRLPGIKIGRMYRIKESDVEKFLGNVSVTPPKTPEPPTNQTQIQEQPQQVEPEQSYYEI